MIPKSNLVEIPSHSRKGMSVFWVYHNLQIVTPNAGLLKWAAHCCYLFLRDNGISCRQKMPSSWRVRFEKGDVDNPEMWPTPDSLNLGDDLGEDVAMSDMSAMPLLPCP